MLSLCGAGQRHPRPNGSAAVRPARATSRLTRHANSPNEPRWLGKYGDPAGNSTDDEFEEPELHYGQWEGLSPESAGLAFASETELAHGERLHKELQNLKDSEKGLAHRWVVVIAMVAAFVLCNMDKVRRSRRYRAVQPAAHKRCTLHCAGRGRLYAVQRLCSFAPVAMGHQARRQSTRSLCAALLTLDPNNVSNMPAAIAVAASGCRVTSKCSTVWGISRPSCRINATCREARCCCGGTVHSCPRPQTWAPWYIRVVAVPPHQCAFSSVRVAGSAPRPQHDFTRCRRETCIASRLTSLMYLQVSTSIMCVLMLKVLLEHHYCAQQR
jgi:hypothetical protein